MTWSAVARPDGFLHRQHDQPGLDLDLRRVVAHALEIIDDQFAQVGMAVNGLSTLERELLGERTDEEYFQDECLAELVNWSCAAETRYWGVDGSDTAHGMWGPLPWWTITVRDDGQEKAAVATPG